MNSYSKTISFWNDIFVKKQPNEDIKSMKIHNDIQNAVDWISNGSKFVIDYGCGSGTMILKCACNENVKKCLGIDISEKTVELAKKTAVINSLEDKIKFSIGSVDKLDTINENSFDAAILSNIIDNVTPDDAERIIKNIKRIVSPNGKILIKVNPYLEENLLKEYGLTLDDDDLYVEKDGIYLRNLTTDQWKKLFEKFFMLNKYKEVYYNEFDQYNRLFLLINNK